MKATTILAAAFSLLAQVAPSSALWDESGDHNLHRRGFAIEKRGSGIKAYEHPHPELVGNGTFNQLLDHTDPSKGTFKQRYWWDAKSWKGPGSPVFLFNPGEDAADQYLGYLDNHTLPGLYADTFEGAVIIIEHRYWGESIPFKTLTAETLQYLDLPNSIADMTYFAKTAKLPFDKAGKGGANAANAPWVLIGGSYSGALAAWTQQVDPGVFWAYHATSAVVEAVHDFHTYFAPVENAIPRNCSADIKTVISYVDTVLSNGTAQQVQKLKAMFGLAHLTHHDDFAEQITSPMWKWQGSHQVLYKFCDYLQSNNGKIIPDLDDQGLGLGIALPLYAAYINETRGETCRQYNCDTYKNTASFNRPTDLTGRRQWDWMLCHQPFGWWQVGPPKSDGTNVVSSFLRPEHWYRQCPLMFPPVNGKMSGSQKGFTEEMLNQWTGGWDAKFQRVLFCIGEDDPWNSATVASKFRPGGPRQSTAEMPIFEVKNGIHVPDLVVAQVQDELVVVEQELKVMDKWLKDWKTAHP